FYLHYYPLTQIKKLSMNNFKIFLVLVSLFFINSKGFSDTLYISTSQELKNLEKLKGENDVVILKEGKYYLRSTLFLKKNILLIGEENAIVEIRGSGNINILIKS